MGNPILAQLVRGDLVESIYTGRLVMLDAAGKIEYSQGDISELTYPRSAVKCVQAAVSLEFGASLENETAAIAAASHSGSEAHLEYVRKILADVQLTETALQTPLDYPLGAPEQRSWIAAGKPKSAIAMNCSGKHAAWINACVHAGIDHQIYLDPKNKLQQRIIELFSELAREQVKVSSVDGCGGPLHAVSLTGMARMIQAAVTAPAGSELNKIITAVTAYPVAASGVGRDIAKFMTAIPGSFLKDGAEGVEVLALADGRTAAFKFDSGNFLIRHIVSARIFQIWGVNNELSDELLTKPVLGGGKPVGLYQAAF
jgi:L-asparaginase II